MALKPAVPESMKPSRRPPQFPLAALLGLMALAGVVIAPVSYMIRGHQGEAGMRLTGMLMLLAGPLLLVVLVSGLLAALDWWNRR